MATVPSEIICKNCKHFSPCYAIFGAKLRMLNHGTCTHSRTVRKLREAGDTCKRWESGQEPPPPREALLHALAKALRQIRDIALILSCEPPADEEPKPRPRPGA